MICSDEEKIKENFNSENIQVQLSCSPQTQTTKNNAQSHIQDKVPKFEVPVINIYVHVPPYKGNNITLNLPRIQPVIHLHFDKIAKILQIRKEENEDVAYQIFKNLLSMTSPKFGDVKIHTSSVKGAYQKSEVVKTRSSSKNCSVDEKLDKAVNMSSNAVSIGSGIVNSNNSNKAINPKNTVDNTLEDNFKLKKAVVLLKDICKSKYYQNLVASAKDGTPQNKKKTQNVSENSDSEYEKFKMCCVKMGTKFYGSESSNCEIQRESAKIVDTGSFVNTPCSQDGGVGNNEKENYEVFGLNMTLTALAEGCNFSEILKRFKLKQSVGLTELRSSLESTTETEIFIKEEITGDDRDVEELDDVGAVTEKLNYAKNCTDESRSCNMDTESTGHERAIKQTNQEEEFTEIPDCDNQLQSNDHSHLNLSSNSDNGNDVTAEVESSLSDQRVTKNSEIYLVSATNSPFLLPINRFTFHQNNLVDSRQFNFSQKRMKSRSESSTKRKTLKKKSTSESLSSEASSLPKRKKCLNQEGGTSQKEKQPSESLEEYIPLQSHGPTKFSVVPLKKLTPYKTHEAKNFKSNMLFGNRVARFKDSNVLKIYAMKKNAYENQAS